MRATRSIQPFLFKSGSLRPIQRKNTNLANTRLNSPAKGRRNLKRLYRQPMETSRVDAHESERNARRQGYHERASRMEDMIFHAHGARRSVHNFTFSP